MPPGCDFRVSSSPRTPEFLSRIGISAENRKAAINLFEQESARPIASQSHTRKRHQNVRLFPKRSRKAIRPTDQEGQFPRTPQCLMTQPIGELLRSAFAATHVEQHLR